MRRLLTFCLLISLFHTSLSQEANTRNKRLNDVLLYGGIGYSAFIYGLGELWYKEQGLGSFRFFNDNSEWNQVDKVGHFYSTYHFSRLGDNVFKWAGLEEKKAAFWGSIVGTALLIPIEVLDGFSEEFGFSYGDMLANAAGSAFFLGQELLWNKQLIKPKFSFHETSLASVKPDLLGDGFMEEFFKDYNGQTYWLSFDIHGLTKDSKFPKWLNLAVGYGAHDMVRAREFQNNLEGFQSYRQWYLGIDFDLSYIPTSNRFLKGFLQVLDIFKLPSPTLEFNRNQTRFHLFYF